MLRAKREREETCSCYLQAPGAILVLPPKKNITVGNDGAAGSESVSESDWKAVDSSSERLSPESAAALFPSHSSSTEYHTDDHQCPPEYSLAQFSDDSSPDHTFSQNSQSLLVSFTRLWRPVP